MSNPWELLGIEPTNDLQAIKNAYATQKKFCNPETNPQEFQALKDAYEHAMRQADPHGSASYAEPEPEPEPEYLSVEEETFEEAEEIEEELPEDPAAESHVRNILRAPFNEAKLEEIFNREEYRRYTDKVFQEAHEGKLQIDSKTQAWWHYALSVERNDQLQAAQPQKKETDGGGIYIIVAVLFLIAYAIKSMTG